MLKNNAVAALRKQKRYKTSRTNTLSISAIFRIAISSVNAHRGLELRCYKFSPRVHDVNKTKTSVQLYDYEAKVWKETFESMGRLKELHLKEQPFTTLNKAPYHCSALSRDYKQYTVTTDNTWNKLINQIIKKEKASHPGSRKTLKFDT
ncbi:hypothetical protein Bpfe_000746 [Biomphalaria pfeifferi]|uniref:Uncharacterized protein n=1 Tax=Biomphalaria pfeifferi TaxID=112525 RepID=A0AAD8CB32_BIOPF|nr:hypothetical protein Bpfe_000746 [Biomphalaria pfeifferi]